MTALSDLLVSTGIKADEAFQRATNAGHQLNRANFFRYLSGDHAKRPAEKTLRALAAGFRIPITKVREAAGVQVGELGPYQPPAFADRLTRDQRVALNELIRTIVKEAGGELDHGSASKNPPGSDDEGGAQVIDLSDHRPEPGDEQGPTQPQDEDETGEDEPPAEESPRAARKAPNVGRRRKRKDDQETD